MLLLPLPREVRSMRGQIVDLDGSAPIPAAPPYTREPLTPVTARELVRAWSDCRHGIGTNTVVSPWNDGTSMIRLIEIETRKLLYAVLTGYTHLHIIGSGEFFIDLRDPEDVKHIRRYAFTYPIPPGRNGRVGLTHPGHYIP